MIDVTMKRGDLLQLALTRRDETGAAVDLTGVTITSQARTVGFVASFTVTVTDAAAGQFVLTALATATAIWPVGLLSADVKFDAGNGNIRRSKSFTIEVKKEVTT